jgi:hypothetical protein
MAMSAAAAEAEVEDDAAAAGSWCLIHEFPARAPCKRLPVMAGLTAGRGPAAADTPVDPGVKVRDGVFTAADAADAAMFCGDDIDASTDDEGGTGEPGGGVDAAMRVTVALSIVACTCTRINLEELC